MSKWKQYSLYHVLKKRLNNRMISQTMVDFCSGLSRVDGIAQSAAVLSFVFALILFYSTGYGFILSFATFILTYWTLAAIISAVDTYYMRKMRIRREALKSIELMLEMVERKRWP